MRLRSTQDVIAHFLGGPQLTLCLLMISIQRSTGLSRSEVALMVYAEFKRQLEHDHLSGVPVEVVCMRGRVRKAVIHVLGGTP